MRLNGQIKQRANFWATSDPEPCAIKTESKFDYIVTCCKYTSEWRNGLLNKIKYIPSFLPFSENYIKNNNNIK